MNLFILSLDPVEAANDQCDKHVVKMVTETAQILCTVLQSMGVTHRLLYRQTHTHYSLHPLLTKLNFRHPLLTKLNFRHPLHYTHYSLHPLLATPTTHKTEFQTPTTHKTEFQTPTSLHPLLTTPTTRYTHYSQN